MASDPSKIAALMSDAIASASASYADGGSVAAWEQEMGRIVARGHMAGWLAGTSERLNVPLDTPLLTEKRLSDVERAEVKELVSSQLEYLKGFASSAPDMSPEAVAARANLYAGAVRGTYYKSATEADLPTYPGACEDCLSNCRCSLDIRDDGVYWQCVEDDKSCAGCVSRGNEWQPYKGEGAEGGVSDTPRTEEAAATAPEPSPFEPREFASASAADKLLSKESAIGKDDLNYFEMAAMQNYQHNGYKDINGALRSGDEDALAENEREIKLIDSVLERSTTAGDLQAYRGLVVKPGSAAEDLVNGWEVGGTFREPGYMSTTIDPNRIDKFFKSLPAEDKKDASFVDIYVRVPGGTNALYMNGAVVQEGMQNYKEERELLLARNSQYRIISKETQPNGRTRVEMEVIDDGE